VDYLARNASACMYEEAPCYQLSSLAMVRVQVLWVLNRAMSPIVCSTLSPRPARSKLTEEVRERARDASACIGRHLAFAPAPVRLPNKYVSTAGRSPEQTEHTSDAWMQPSPLVHVQLGQPHHERVERRQDGVPLVPDDRQHRATLGQLQGKAQ